MSGRAKSDPAVADDDVSTTLSTRHEFLTARQLAAILQVSESTVRRLAREGRIPSVRLTPRLTRYHLESVRQALDGKPQPRARRTIKQTDSKDLPLPFEDT